MQTADEARPRHRSACGNGSRPLRPAPPRSGSERRARISSRDAAGRATNAPALGPRRARLPPGGSSATWQASRSRPRDMWSFPSFESLVQDVRYAIRSLIKAPGFSVVAVLVLAIGIGANTAMFSLVDAMLLRGLPYPDADRLVVLIGNVQRATVERRGNSLPDHLDWRAKATHFDDMAAYSTHHVTLFGVDEPERDQRRDRVGAVLLAARRRAGPRPDVSRGRRCGPEPRLRRRAQRRTLAPALRRRPVDRESARFSSSGQTYTVIGIMPPGFTGVSDNAQMWMPFMMQRLRARQSRQPRLPDARATEDGRDDRSGAGRARRHLRQLAAAYPATNDKRAVEVESARRRNIRPAASPSCSR